MIEVMLHESLKIIKNGAFMEREGLKAITFPISLQYIGRFAFVGWTNPETVKLSRKTKIGYKAFEGFKGRDIKPADVIKGINTAWAASYF